MGKECGMCFEMNADGALECVSCGTAFENVEAAGKPKITFIGTIDGKVIEIPEDGAVIGRDCGIAPDVFNHKWVSESHCRVSIDRNNCYIEDVGSDGNGSTNGTFINGDKLPKRTPTKFYDGNKLKIAHLLFDIKIEYPQSVLADEPIEEPAEQLVWAIECPVSGKRFEVESPDAKIAKCDCCDDEMDQKRISKIKPKQVKLTA